MNEKPSYNPIYSGEFSLPVPAWVVLAVLLALAIALVAWFLWRR
jgi:hypothetical protein